MLLNLRVATIGPAGFFPGTLNGGVGGNLAFFGNTFIGDGTSRLVLQLGSTGTATVDTASNTMSIDGSPTSNTISGFTTFDPGHQRYVHRRRAAVYRVTFAPDPDTLVMTPNSGNVTFSGITSTNFLLDFRGFSPSFDAAALAADTDTSTGSTVITLSPTSVITLAGYTGGIAPGNVLFEAACYLKGNADRHTGGRGGSRASVRGRHGAHRLRRHPPHRLDWDRQGARHARPAHRRDPGDRAQGRARPTTCRTATCA